MIDKKDPRFPLVQSIQSSIDNGNHVWTKNNVYWDLNELKNKLAALNREIYDPTKSYVLPKGKFSKKELAYIRPRAKKLICRTYNGSICNPCGYIGDFFGIEDHHPDRKNASIGDLCRGNAKASLWDMLYECDISVPLCPNCHAVQDNKKASRATMKALELLNISKNNCSCFECDKTIDNLAALYFVYRENTDKKFMISEVNVRKNGTLSVPILNKKSGKKRTVILTPKQFVTEILKCDLLCANCELFRKSYVAKFHRFYQYIIYWAINFIETEEQKLSTGRKRLNIYQNKPHTRYSSKKVYSELVPDGGDDFFANIRKVNPEKERVNPFAHLDVDNRSMLDKNREKHVNNAQNILKNML